MATVAEGVLAFLTPVLGDRGAKRLLLSYCAKMNKQEKDLTHEDLAEMGQFLFNNLRIFVGSDRANLVIQMLSNKK